MENNNIATQFIDTSKKQSPTPNENEILAEQILPLLEGKSISTIETAWNFFVMPKVKQTIFSDEKDKSKPHVSIFEQPGINEFLPKPGDGFYEQLMESNKRNELAKAAEAQNQ